MLSASPASLPFGSATLLENRTIFVEASAVGRIGGERISELFGSLPVDKRRPATVLLSHSSNHLARPRFASAAGIALTPNPADRLDYGGGFGGGFAAPEISFSCAAPGFAGRRTRKHK